MKAYKLTNRDCQTHNGHQWVVGDQQRIEKPGNMMCTDEVFHYYDHPLVAVLINPIHADIKDPLLWEIEIDECVAHDGLKGGCKVMMLKKQIELPVFTTLQNVEIAIRLALINYSEPGFVSWANAWLSEGDRSRQSAARAAEAAARAAEAAARAAEAAARAGVLAARAAQEWSKTVFIPILEKVYGGAYEICPAE